jgi:hypothetical protein
MKCPSLFVLLVSSLLPLAAADPIKRDFEADPVGQRPAGFEIARTGGGAEGKWVVRTEKGAAKNLKVATNAWHTVKVQAAGNHFVVFMDGNRIFDGTEDTFKEAGKVGLWTKADSVIEFDDFTAEGRD